MRGSELSACVLAALLTGGAFVVLSVACAHGAAPLLNPAAAAAPAHHHHPQPQSLVAAAIAADGLFDDVPSSLPPLPAPPSDDADEAAAQPPQQHEDFWAFFGLGQADIIARVPDDGGDGGGLTPILRALLALPGPTIPSSPPASTSST